MSNVRTHYADLVPGDRFDHPPTGRILTVVSVEETGTFKMGTDVPNVRVVTEGMPMPFKGVIETAGDHSVWRLP